MPTKDHQINGYTVSTKYCTTCRCGVWRGGKGWCVCARVCARAWVCACACPSG